MKNKILVIDGNNLAHRCKHVFSLSNAGEDVSVLYGFLYVLISYLRKFSPTSVVVAWDGGIPKFRTDLLPSYKANRMISDQMDYQIFRNQMNKLQNILPNFGVLSIQNYGSEADDIMSQVSRIVVAEECIIVSNDRDMVQCINENTSVFLPSSKDGGNLVTHDKLSVFIPVKKSSYLDWRALQGDSSDNIIGVRMIGEKTATKLFLQYGSLSAIVTAATSGDVPGRVGGNIVEFGSDNLLRNVKVMNLWQDRTGARQAISDAADLWMPFSKTIVKIFLMKYAFISFMEPSVYRLFKELENISLIDTRFPICKERRQAREW